jgi:hypothetical protein
MCKNDIKKCENIRTNKKTTCFTQFRQISSPMRWENLAIKLDTLQYLSRVSPYLWYTVLDAQVVKVTCTLYSLCWTEHTIWDLTWEYNIF